jgi:tetratricopeptide (TPR) repeat protein
MTGALTELLGGPGDAEGVLMEEISAPGMCPEPEIEKPPARPVRGALPALRGVGQAKMKGNAKRLAAMLAAQGSIDPAPSVVDDGLAEVLQDQLKMAETRLMRTASQLENSVDTLKSATSPELDDVVIRDWDDGEFLGGDPQPESPPRPKATPLSERPVNSRVLALHGSPPDSPPADFHPVNIHQISEERTIRDSRDRFAKYDKDGDGQLSPTEVQRMFRDMELQVDEATMFQLINLFDSDCNGQIDYGEWSKLCVCLNVGTYETALEKQKLAAETDRVEDAIPHYLSYIGDNHPQVASMCEYCARLMKRQGRITEAAAMAKQAREIRMRPYRTTSHGHGQGHGGADGHGHVGEILERKFVDDE